MITFWLQRIMITKDLIDHSETGHSLEALCFEHKLISINIYLKNAITEILAFQNYIKSAWMGIMQRIGSPNVMGYIIAQQLRV